MTSFLCVCTNWKIWVFKTVLTTLLNSHSCTHTHTHTHTHTTHTCTHTTLHTVYCACLLASHVLPLKIDTDSNPQFYINVADIEQMETMDNYVACQSVVRKYRVSLSLSTCSTLHKLARNMVSSVVVKLVEWGRPTSKHACLIESCHSTTIATLWSNHMFQFRHSLVAYI